LFCELNIVYFNMFSSQKDIIWLIYNNSSTVFTMNSVALLSGETDFQSLNQKLNYYVRTGKLLNPRKGIYAKPDYDPLELTCLLYTPSYISLEYVLQKAGVLFQYDSRITAVSYLSRSLEFDNVSISYRKIKNEILIDLAGISRVGNINIATPERSFLDMLYLNSSYYFDNVQSLDAALIHRLLPLYGSKVLTKRAHKYIKK